MSKSEPQTQGSIGGFAGDLGDSLIVFTVGTDGDGATHQYHRPTDTVIVYNGRDDVERHPLEGRTLDAWIEFVDDKRGWQSFGQLASAGVGADLARKEGGE